MYRNKDAPIPDASNPHLFPRRVLLAVTGLSPQVVTETLYALTQKTEHGIEPEEAEECFFHEYDYGRDDRRFDDVYILDGRTDRGRRLRLIFQDKGNGLARIFTGWDLTRKKRTR